MLRKIEKRVRIHLNAFSFMGNLEVLAERTPQGAPRKEDCSASALAGDARLFKVMKPDAGDFESVLHNTRIFSNLPTVKEIVKVDTAYYVDITECAKKNGVF
jgi:hypothetical protein